MQPPVVEGAADLPAPVRTVLTTFVSSATTFLGPTVRSIVLFGSGAENRLRATSDVNVVVVLGAFDAERVRSLSETLLAGRAAVRLNVMWLLESELSTAAEAFGVKFADILRRRRVLWGSDPFKSVAVPRHLAIARLRQVLMNLVMRLRATYAMHSQREERLAAAVADAAGPLRASAAEIIELEGSAAPPPREALEIFSRSLPSGDWERALATISQVRESGAAAPGAAGPLLLKVIDLAGHLLERANALTPR